MKIIISGLTASGKSTLAKGLSSALGMEYFSGSTKLREFMPPKEFEYWESQKGLDAIKFRLKHPKYDRLLDNFILKYVKTHDNIVLDSWVASWKVKDRDAIKIYLKVGLETRARRVSERDSIDYDSALRFMKEKDKLSSKIYFNLYKIRIGGEDLMPFDLVVNSSDFSIDELRDLCLGYIDKRKRAI
jgi:predicted cytidylate kinase